MENLPAEIKWTIARWASVCPQSSAPGYSDHCQVTISPGDRIGAPVGREYVRGHNQVRSIKPVYCCPSCAERLAAVMGREIQGVLFIDDAAARMFRIRQDERIAAYENGLSS